MIGTYAAVLAICVASLAIGQAAIALCGGAALVVAGARGRAWRCSARSAGGRCGCRGDGVVVGGRSCWLLPSPRSPTCGGGWRAGRRRCAPAGRWRWSRCWRPRCRSWSKATSGSSAPASTPTCPSTCWPPTGSPTGTARQLLHQGYPLGPHAIVVALNKGLGIGLVQGFSGLTVAVAVLAPLTALAAFAELRPLPRTAGALVVGLAYMVASYFAQGAFKETMQALFLLAFVLALRECGPRLARRCRCASSRRR